MINRLMDKKRQNEGFTLIELLIVVIILGILAAVVVFGVATFREDSTDKACQTDRKQVETAVAAYIAKNGKAPNEAAPGAPPNDGATPTAQSIVDSGYLKSYPTGGDDYDIDYDKGTGDSEYTVLGVNEDSDEDDNAKFMNCNP